MPTPDNDPRPYRARSGRWRWDGLRVGAAVERIGAATPPERERAVDGLRAAAILGVVLGHWLVSALVVWADGGLRVSSPLRHLPELTPLSWGFQLLGLFFLVGGYVGTKALARSRVRGESGARWLRARLVRLGRPVVLVAAAWGAVLTAFVLLGVPTATTRTGALLVLQPLWFIAVYAAVTALTPLAVAADRRFGVGAALPALLVVAAVDLARYGPWHEAVPGWVGALNTVPAWLFAYQLGIAWAHGRLRRPAAVALLVLGALGFALLVTQLGYPWSAVGVPGEPRGNAHPPSLFVPALAAAQSGAALLLLGPLERLLRRPVPWACVALLNLGALTVFCWHQSALVLVSAAGSAWGVVEGLTSVADGPAWLLARLAWLAVFAVALVALCAAVRRFEGPWRSTPLGSGVARAAVGVGAAVFCCAVVALV